MCTISWPGWKLEIFHLILGTPRVTLFAGKGTDRIANGQTKNDMVMTPIIAPHTMNFGSELVQAKNVSGRNIFCSTLIAKSREGKFFEFLHCPLEALVKWHRYTGQSGSNLWFMFAWPSREQCMNTKKNPPLLLAIKVDQNTFYFRDIFCL